MVLRQSRTGAFLYFGAHEGLADLTQSEPFRFTFESGFKTLNGFLHRFVTEPEGLVMHRDNVLGTGGIRHFQGLLRVAMIPDPGVISADRHDAHGKRTARTKSREQRCPGSIARE